MRIDIVNLFVLVCVAQGICGVVLEDVSGNGVRLSCVARDDYPMVVTLQQFWRTILRNHIRRMSEGWDNN